jgi:hypothetical protein
MASEPYLHAKNEPSPWTKEAITHFSNNGRSILSLVANAGSKPAIDAPYLFVIRFNPPSAWRQEFITWYGKKHLAKVSNLNGVYRGRLYEVDREVSDIPTAEQKISGSKAGQQMFFALFEIASPDLPLSRPWKEAYDVAEFAKGKTMKLENLKEEIYWLDFTMYAHQQ